MKKISSFQTLINSFGDDKGKKFELFVKWFLQNDPAWSQQVAKVWMWDEYPKRWGPDCGIDLVIENTLGQHCAVQAKCYAEENTISKSDIDKFLSESNRKEIQSRLLIATTDKISENAKRVCASQESKPVIKFLLSDFNASAIKYPKQLKDLSTYKFKNKFKPKPHQKEAIQDVIKGFKKNERGQLIMACGTGKTFTTLWISEELKTKKVLYVVPTLSLISEALRSWTEASNSNLNTLCVCSDKSVTKQSSDSLIESVSDFNFPTTNNSKDIQAFINLKNNKNVIFTTYNSLKIISEAQEKYKLEGFDLIVLDEAHRCAGSKDSFYFLATDNSKIKAKRRLFTTATPRIFQERTKKRIESLGGELVGMEDEKVFGSVFHTLKFSDAIERKLLTDYQVAVVGIDEKTTASLIQSRAFLKTDKGTIYNAEYLAILIGFLKTLNTRALRKVITFHSTIKKALNFSNDLIEIDKELKNRKFKIRSKHVSGQMNAYERRNRINELDSINDKESYVLTNSRCLSEGVDVPTLDSVAFVDPRRSQVDIIQAVGRAIRLSNNKKLGTIIIPIFIKENHSAGEAIAESDFAYIWDVINALKAHDDTLQEELNFITTNLGEKISKKDYRIDKINKIVFDIPTSVPKNFESSLKTIIARNCGDDWDYNYGLLKSYVSEFNKIPVGHGKRYHGIRLGPWCHKQRQLYRNSQLSKEKFIKLEKITGWFWDKFGEEFYEFLETYKQHVKKNGHPKSIYGARKGVLQTLRHHTRKKINGELNTEYKKSLEAIPSFKWPLIKKEEIGTSDENWNVHSKLLLEFMKNYPNEKVNVSTAFIRIGGNKFKPLRRWVGAIEGKYHNKTLDQDKLMFFNKIKGWTWKSQIKYITDDDLINICKEYYKINKHIHPNSSEKFKNTGFGFLVLKRKQLYKKNKLEKAKIKLFENLKGWTWETRQEFNLRKSYDEVASVFKRYGVDKTWENRKSIKLETTGGTLLSWILLRRGNYNKKELSPENKKKFESLEGFDLISGKENSKYNNQRK